MMGFSSDSVWFVQVFIITIGQIATRWAGEDERWEKSFDPLKTCLPLLNASYIGWWCRKPSSYLAEYAFYTPFFLLRYWFRINLFVFDGSWETSAWNTELKIPRLCQTVRQHEIQEFLLVIWPIFHYALYSKCGVYICNFPFFSLFSHWNDALKNIA